MVHSTKQLFFFFFFFFFLVFYFYFFGCFFFFTSDAYKKYNLRSCQKFCDALVYLLDNIFIRFGTTLYRQTISILMGTECALLVADLFFFFFFFFFFFLFFFCYERGFMKYLLRENQADIIEAFNLFDVYFNSISRHLDDLLNIDNIYFDKMVDRIYTTGLQFKRANSSDTEAHIFGFESMYI